jgi:hypothetical protein
MRGKERQELRKTIVGNSMRVTRVVGGLSAALENKRENMLQPIGE